MVVAHRKAGNASSLEITSAEGLLRLRLDHVASFGAGVEPGATVSLRFMDTGRRIIDPRVTHISLWLGMTKSPSVAATTSPSCSCRQA
jgi:hypothetical protein